MPSDHRLTARAACAQDFSGDFIGGANKAAVLRRHGYLRRQGGH
jgi:hypothetical protein